MAFDAGMLCAVLHEIGERCLGAKVEKVHQPTREEIVFLLRGKKLSVNIGSSCPRISMTNLSGDNPATPPMFCMLLRKHLCGATLLGLEQCGFDRVCRITFSGYDEMGFRTEKRLYAELMGKYSNLVLTDGEDKIIAVAKPIDFSDSEIRQLLPGLRYILPALQAKADPLSATAEEFLRFFGEAPQGKSTARWLTERYRGTAISVGREIVFRTTGDSESVVERTDGEKLWKSFSDWFGKLKEYKITPAAIYNAKNEPLEYSYLPLTYWENAGEIRCFPDIGSLFDSYFGEKDRADRIRSRAADLVKTVSHTCAKLEKKIALQKEEFEASGKGEEYRRMGDLITAEIYRLHRGAVSFTATDYYSDPPAEVTVPLDPRLTPAQNAQKYYKKYTKAKKAHEVLEEQIAKTEEELAYMESVTAFLLRAQTETDLQEIREELYRSGYAPRLKNYTPMRQLRSRPMEFTTSGGYRVLCGRNNLQNDMLTFKIADKGDLWFHVKGVPGSHVILVCGGEEPPEADYTEAAEIAATYSSATAELVAVDYTRVKNVKKPPASKPGFVTYKTNYTAFVRKKTT